MLLFSYFTGSEPIASPALIISNEFHPIHYLIFRRIGCKLKELFHY